MSKFTRVMQVPETLTGPSLVAARSFLDWSGMGDGGGPKTKHLEWLSPCDSTFLVCNPDTQRTLNTPIHSPVHALSWNGRLAALENTMLTHMAPADFRDLRCGGP